MLILLGDPAGITGIKRFPWNLEATLQENIAEHLQCGGDCDIAINGVRVDPLTEPRMGQRPTAQDHVVIMRRPEGLETWILVASALLAVASYAMIPKVRGGPEAPAESPNNSLTAQTNIARAYQAIPDVYGYRRVWPDLIQPSKVEYIGNLKYVTEWLCISRGKGTLTNVQYAETPIDKIDGAEWSDPPFEPVGASPYPELNATTLTDVYEPFASPEVNGQELNASVSSTTAINLNADGTSGATSFTLTMPEAGQNAAGMALIALLQTRVGIGSLFISTGAYGYPAYPELDGAHPITAYAFDGGTNSHVFTCSIAALSTTYDIDSVVWAITALGIAGARGPFQLPLPCDRIQWNLTFPRGLKGSVTIRAEWWKVNASGVEVGGSRETYDAVYTADTFDPQYRTEIRTPAAGLGTYRVQFTRLTAESGNGADQVKLEELFGARFYATKQLPGVTVIRVRTKATTEATGFSERKFNLRFERHVRTLTTTTLSASRNFARAMAHLWCVAGQSIAELDTTTLAAINAEFGENSALLRFDGSLDDANMSLGERLQLIANNVRCVLWRDGQVWTVTRDQARTLPELQLDYRNLAASGDSVINYAAHLPASNDGVELEYVDEATQAKKAYVRLNITTGVPVPGTSANPLKIRLPGCATLSQAENRAKLEARKLLFQRTSVTDTALAEAGSLGLGSLVRWIDPNDFAGDDKLQAGEVLAINGLVITTSEPLDFKGQSSGRMLFTGVDGQHLGAPIVVTPAGTNTVALASLPAGLYVRDDTRQLGSRYAFGVGLTAAEFEAAGLYTVTELRPTPEREVGLALINYDARCYVGDLVTPTTTAGRAGARASNTTVRPAKSVARAGARASNTTVKLT